MPKLNPKNEFEWRGVCDRCKHPVFHFDQYNPPRVLSGNGKPHSVMCAIWAGELVRKLKRERARMDNLEISFTGDESPTLAEIRENEQQTRDASATHYVGFGRHRRKIDVPKERALDC